MALGDLNEVKLSLEKIWELNSPWGLKEIRSTLTPSNVSWLAKLIETFSAPPAFRDGITIVIGFTARLNLKEGHERIEDRKTN